MGKDNKVNKRYEGTEARNPDAPRMGKKGFKISKLLEALNQFPFKPGNKRDKK